jgi:glycosyltransferase involved in cell wall biosynthesis
MRAEVSVIIPYYNDSVTIGRALRSIEGQSLKPFEIIVINDASHSVSLKILEKLKRKYGDWVNIVNLPVNRGAASARNIGWDLATQPYIAFLDSDDAWHSRKVEIQYGYMKKNPDIVLSGHLYRELSKGKVGTLNWPVELKSVQKTSRVTLLLKNQFVTPSVMVKKDIPFRFSEGRRYMEDHFLWLEILSEKTVVVKLNVELAAVFKPMFGASGLSSNMWLMEKSELSNYQYLYRQKRLGLFQYAFLQCFSVAKFIRRLLVVYVVRRVGMKITSFKNSI